MGAAGHFYCAGGCLPPALRFVLGLLLMIVFSACRASPASVGGGDESGKAATLNVFAAASLTGAFGAIGEQFESQHPGAAVVFNFVGSQQLAQQLADGAPADVFASANWKQMDAVIQNGRVLSGAAQTFANNRLVVIYPKANPAGLAQLADLGHPGLKLALAAKEVPVGQYALDFLAKAAADQAFGAAFRDEVIKNVVSYESDVKAVLTKVVLGEADAGIVYRSDISRDSAAKVGQIEIPDALNVIAHYPIAAVQDSANPDLARAFVEYVLSADGQVILAAYGFIPVTLGGEK